MLTITLQFLNPAPENSDIHRIVTFNEQADVNVLGSEKGYIFIFIIR